MLVRCGPNPANRPPKSANRVAANSLEARALHLRRTGNVKIVLPMLAPPVELLADKRQIAGRG